MAKRPHMATISSKAYDEIRASVAKRGWEPTVAVWPDGLNPWLSEERRLELLEEQARRRALGLPVPADLHGE